ncbi:Lrp/AsnC family transcriptional regulator [Tsukamurella soli]|uniref:Lrp/AsnC family transcriptional regulator n=1 Tax=Tsukamurella soli TaxID=644556 RepID=A0ABP8JSN5_9ACTN
MFLDGRVSFSRIAEILGVSDQTVARRFRRLQRRHGLRVVCREAAAATDAEWLLRLRCTPGRAGAVADLLARRDETHWIRICAGGAEVVCGVTESDAHPHEALVDELLPATRATVVLAAHRILHTFRGGRTTLPSLTGALSDDEAGRIRALPAAPAPPVVLDAQDRVLLAELARDGRAGYAPLGIATGMAEATVRRRLGALLDARAVYFDVDLDATSLGYTETSLLWITAAPARVDAVGRAIAAVGDVAFAAATTGPSNIVASVLSRGTTDLYRLVTSIGAIDGVDRLAADPVLRTVKASGAVSSAGRAGTSGRSASRGS